MFLRQNQPDNPALKLDGLRRHSPLRSTSLVALLNSSASRALVAVLHPGVVAEQASILVAALVLPYVKAVFRLIANSAHRAFSVLVVPFLPRPCYRFF